MGFALARWSIVARSLQKGTLKLAGTEVLPYGSAYYFVCPVPYLAMPKVAQFREWVLAAARATWSKTEAMSRTPMWRTAR